MNAVMDKMAVSECLIWRNQFLMKQRALQRSIRLAYYTLFQLSVFLVAFFFNPMNGVSLGLFAGLSAFGVWEMNEARRSYSFSIANYEKALALHRK